MSDIQGSATPELKRTALHDLHRSLGARMVGFAGYDMPVQYPSGIIDEHLHTRRQAGLFDVSHMGQAILEGPDVATRLETLVPADILGLAPGQMRYTQFLDEDGHILDDLMVSRLPNQGNSERLFIVANASMKDADFAHISTSLPDLKLTRRDGHELLALQGPAAVSVLARVFPEVAAMSFMSIREFDREGARFMISRSGYTGEDGFEISLPFEVTAAFAQELLANPEVRPIGLGARDSLRLEAGLCLYGHDIDRTIDPIEAGLAWSISKRRRTHGGFPGATQIGHALAEGPSRRRIGLVLEGKAPAREGAAITTPDGFPIGHVTSGGYAPSLGRPIAMGLVAAPYASVGKELHLDVRGKKLAATISAMPFVPHQYHRGN